MSQGCIEKDGCQCDDLLARLRAKSFLMEVYKQRVSQMESALRRIRDLKPSDLDDGCVGDPLETDADMLTYARYLASEALPVQNFDRLDTQDMFALWYQWDDYAIGVDWEGEVCDANSNGD